MANISPSISAWSATEASNQPDGTDTLNTAADMRAILAGVRRAVGSRATIASAATVDMSTSEYGIIEVTHGAGTTAITALGTVSAGVIKRVVFTVTGGTLTITHNGTSLILPGSANITVATGDTAVFESLGAGNWKCHSYFRATGLSVVSSYYDDANTANNYTIAASRGSNAETIALKTKAGTDPTSSDPIYLNFRNVTAATGDYSTVTLTAATSIVISSGSTLGMVANQTARLWLVAFNDAGTVRLGIINPEGRVRIQDDQLSSSTAEGGAGAADSAATFYTGTAVTSKAYRILGYLDYSLATPGTWTSAPSKIQIFGPGVLLPMGSSITLGTEQATTSGTTIDFTGIPAGTKRITVNFVGVSSSGSSTIIVQIGDSGGAENTGYSSSVETGGTPTSSTAGFILCTSWSAAYTGHGSVILTLEDESDNTWCAIGNFIATSTAAWGMAGSKALTGTLDRIRITTSGGTDTFDAGAINIAYE